MKYSPYLFRYQVAAFLIVTAFVAGNVGAQPTHAASPPVSRDANAVLLSAASPFEDMTEFALDDNVAGIDRASKTYSGQSARVDAVLSPGQRGRLHARIAAIAKARGIADNAAIAMNAVEAYGILVGALRPAGMKVPAEVARLDYAGFKLKVLMHGASKDWPAARAVAQGADVDWSAVKARVTDKGLRDAMDVATQGMQQATASSNAGMAGLAADIDLALVDLLERHFEAARK